MAARAAAVDLTYSLTLDGMSTGTCAGKVCAASLGTITEVGNTTGSIKITVDLAPGVSFHANHSGNSGTGDFFFFDVTDAGGSLGYSAIGDNGTIGTKTYSYGTPVSGSFAPNAGNFPGRYDYESPCTNDTAGKICNSTYTFTVNAGTGGTLDFIAATPPTTGDFKGDNIYFVADLSIAGGTAGLCTGGSACTGDVGALLTNSVVTTGTVPEPSTWAMLLIGFAGLGYAGYRKTRTERTAFADA
jgi:hypothetical protein